MELAEAAVRQAKANLAKNLQCSAGSEGNKTIKPWGAKLPPLARRANSIAAVPEYAALTSTEESAAPVAAAAATGAGGGGGAAGAAETCLIFTQSKSTTGTAN